MKTLHPIAFSALLGLAASSCSEAPKEGVASPEPAGAARATVVDLQTSALVKAVDAEKRLITLEGPRGNTGVYKVGEQVQRLSDIRVGDKINAKYRVAAVAELREPTAEEKSAPITVVEEGDRAALDVPPAAAIWRGVRVVTTIEALDRSAQTVTVKGPLDGLVAVRVDDPTAFDRLKVGQNIVVTFAETLVISVEPGPK
jgi:hypothetical protein